MTKKTVQMVTTGPTFTQNAVLVPAGTLVSVDTDVIDIEAKDVDGKTVKDKDGKVSTPGLVDASNYTPEPPVVMGAIAPTGPNPTAPQQLAPGMIQTPGGYATKDGTPVVAEGSAEAIEIEEGGEPTSKRKGKDPLA